MNNPFVTPNTHQLKLTLQPSSSPVTSVVIVPMARTATAGPSIIKPKPLPEDYEARIEEFLHFLDSFESESQTMDPLSSKKHLPNHRATFSTFEHQRLESVYSFSNKEKVLGFLETKQFLILLLLEARFHIAKLFPGSEVFLEIDTDPETTTDEQLVAFIATSLPSNEAFARLKQLDEDWWLNALDRAQGKLCITVEFQ
ncbi:MAG: hypothetical protein JO202_18485 [Ktedonobacteraceae bacterium]|nr:hypothetical protein [Ktedonobacteraceae bacterium]